MERKPCMEARRKPADRLSEVNLPAPSKEKPAMFALGRGERDWLLTRRSFVGATAAAFGAISSSRVVEAQTLGCRERAHREQVSSLALTPDGRTLVSGDRIGESTPWDYTGSVKLWKLPEGAHYATRLEPNPVRAVAVSPNGRLFASGGYDEVRLYNLPDGTLYKTLKGEGSFVRALAVTPDGKLLASGGGGTINLWSLPDGELIGSFSDWSHGVDALAISPYGDLLASSAGREIKLWSLPDGRLLNVCGTGGYTNSLVINADGGLLISGGYGQPIELRYLPDGGFALSFPDERDFSSTTLAISPDGGLLVSGHGGSIRLWAMPWGDEIKRFQAFEYSSVTGMGITSDGKILVTGSGDGRIKLWSLPECEPFSSCLVDVASNPEDKQGAQYEQGGILHTVPCGSPIPQGATCTCNCVRGNLCSCVGYTPAIGSGGGGTITLPCGSPIPPGYICTCNCISRPCTIT